MNHYYPNVPGLGNVAVSRHAQTRCGELDISQELFERVLIDPSQPDVLEGQEIIWREKDNIRLVILVHPIPFKGAKLVKTVIRIEGRAEVKKG